ncbi:kinase-like domain-containing protein [Rhizophagus irregularis DAOM 181602=DAOM 197198]|uniref:Kinase-like domain-containing protein n=1 Tax=Rhizophagus irregularis (strain DAOM 181602 / DAOM 197198 / MUCL 43194) TaxID=747089 RepID=A0A2P4PH92_RHIID|nr:kinase-like domain-containing protein [Rhizophagus irregularis DAOM 181602=DAOM 197198]POG64764.1 kinase-like domain-containing protein [Rhizophagus irregularis DAOM 181602=DAOM 197198]|eukprot:XP_025171630.1 kinase-like domain-containing protein [Rhizophagus irregularis DAOM 181602=DAOM 197198]
MSNIRYELIYELCLKAHMSFDYNIYNDIHKRNKFHEQLFLSNKSLTDDEKTKLIKILCQFYDRNNIIYNSGTKRVCENCNQECLATSFCEYCVRNYLKENFLNWTSGNDDIDNLIQKCQMETFMPNKVIEWIPYNNFKNINYLTKGGFSEIYTADWIDGYYEEWDFKNQQLVRNGTQEVILKRLDDAESINRTWFEEAKSHLTIGNKWVDIVRCFGLTKDPLNGNYMLVMRKMDMDLRKYLQQKHNQLTWKERIKIISEITNALYRIVKENAIHRDLHSGNILYLRYLDYWLIGDLGFCGPADKSSKSIYGNLPYIAPEIIAGSEYTFASDIYSIAMLMWEVSSGQPPFINYEHDYSLAMRIINGMRPKIVPETPLEYKLLMKQCWNADPLKRPNIKTYRKQIREIHLSYQNMENELLKPKVYKPNGLETNSTNSRLFSSNIYKFENLPEPKNATEEEQEVFYSKSYGFKIPDNINEFNKSDIQNVDISIKVNSKKLSNKIFEMSQVNLNYDIRDYYKKEAIQQIQQIKRANININDENEIYNNPNLHSKEQNILEIPDG